MSRIRVLVADDHSVVRAGITNLLSSQTDIEVTSEAASTDELLAKATEKRPDVILLDLSMPTTGGLQAMRDLRRRGIMSRCLVLSMHDDPSMIRSALAAGVSGYLVKSGEVAEVGNAIRAVHRGRSYYGVSLHGSELPAVTTPLSAPAAEDGRASLSTREKQVLRLLGLGHTYRTIASQLNVSEKSVETYRTRISEKLGLKTRADLVRYSLETGLLEAERLGSASLSGASSTGRGAGPGDASADLEEPVFEKEAFARSVRTVFQPILEVSGSHQLFALECLSRGPAGTSLEAADRLFAWLRAAECEEAADQICLERALRSAQNLPGMPLLSVNLHARTLAGPELPAKLTSLLASVGVAPSRLILEIVEHGGALEVPGLLRNLEKMRAQGIRIAIDDFGLGQSNFHRLLESRPDFLKIERYFVHGWSSDYRKQVVIESLSRLARRLGTQTIAEGIETPSQLEMVRNHGIELAQGYLFSPPVPRDQLIKSGALDG